MLHQSTNNLAPVPQEDATGAGGAVVKGFRNGISYERTELTLNRRGYRVTGSPDLQTDRHPLIEIYIAETMHGMGDIVRFAHWRRVTGRKRKEEIRAIAIERTREASQDSQP